MIGELNYNYYGIPIGREASAQWDSSVKLGSLTNRTMLEEQDKHGRGKAFDESIYLWKIKPSASFACNAAFNIDTGNTLNIDIAINKRDNPVSLAVGTVATQSTAPYVGFYTQPRDRIGYDDLRAYNTQNSNLCYDIPYNRYCLFCGIQCLDYDSSPLATVGQSLSTLKAYIDNNNADVVFLRSDLYTGTASDRRISNIYAPTTEEGYTYPYYESIIADILTNRPIPESATLIKSAIQDGHDTYIDNVVYSPFTTAIKRNWYQSKVTSINQLLNIGIHVAYDYSTLRTGAQTISGANKVTGQFMKVSTDEQIFNDVCYKWVIKWYDDATGAILDNGYDITSRTGGGRLISVLTITDDKGQTKGEAVTRAVKHELAYIGFYFTDTQALAMSGTLGSSGDGVGVYLPEKIGGVTTGNYFTGDDIKNVPYANAENCSDFTYKPDEAAPIDDDGLTDTIINTGTISAGVTYYAMTDTNVKDLTTWLNTIYDPTDETQFIQDFKGTNPADYITTVMYYPFDVPYIGVSQPVTVGKLTAGSTQGAKLTYEYGNMYSYGSYTFPKFGDFRDYLTKLSVIIPFCGTVELDPIIWAGREITIKMAVDFPTGVCTAYLYRTGANGAKAIIDSVSGQIGVPLPLSSFSNGSYQVAITNMLAQGAATNRQIMMSTLGAGAGVLTAAFGAYTGNYKMAFGGAVAAVTSNSQANAGADKLENIAYNIDHTKPTLQSVSGGSPFINCGQDYRCIIIRCVPVFAPGYDATAYGKTTGFATCRQGTLSSISHGFTQCAGVDLDGVSATATEKAMIFNALQSGVFV